MPIVAAAVIGVGGSLLASRSASRTADRQIEASQAATDQATALQREQFDRMWSATETQRQAGTAATARLSALSGLTPNTDAAGNPQSTTEWLRSTPGFDANLQTGTTALNTSLAKRGMGQSGAAARAAIRFGQDFGDRIFNQERSALQALAGIGSTATSQGGAAGNTMVNNIQTALTNNANNQASSYQRQGDATQSAIGGVVGSALWGLNQWNNRPRVAA